MMPAPAHRMMTYCCSDNESVGLAYIVVQHITNPDNTTAWIDSERGTRLHAEQNSQVDCIAVAALTGDSREYVISMFGPLSKSTAWYVWMIVPTGVVWNIIGNHHFSF